MHNHAQHTRDCLSRQKLMSDTAKPFNKSGRIAVVLHESHLQLLKVVLLYVCMYVRMYVRMSDTAKCVRRGGGF